jgi:NarL family two-component system response regulator LiaR
MRVLVADDHSLFRDGLVSLLEAAGHDVVGQVGDGEAAVEGAGRLRPELVLLDISMPGMDGLEALRRIKAEYPEIQVVMLTVSDDDSTLLQALRAGAQGYLLKSLDAGEFLEMVQGIGRGEAAMSRRTTARLLEGLSREDEQPEPHERLTDREKELLALVARGLSNKAIAAEMSISENTVKYYMKNILQKLGAQNRTEAAAYALQSGLVPPPHNRHQASG